MPRKSKNPPKKISASIHRNAKGLYGLFWRNVEDGKTQGKYFKTPEEAQAEHERVVRILAREIINGDYDTTENRTRKYIEVEARLKREKKDGINVKVVQTSEEESGIKQYVAYKAKRIISAIDDLIENGKEEEAFKLRISLLRNRVDKVYEELPQKYKKTKRDMTDVTLTKRISGLARSLDKRHEKYGGDGYRNECMSFLKLLSAKLEEWRASE